MSCKWCKVATFLLILAQSAQTSLTTNNLKVQIFRFSFSRSLTHTMQRSLRQEVGPRQKRRRYAEAVKQLLLDCEKSESSSGNNINCVKFDLLKPHHYRRRF